MERVDSQFGGAGLGRSIALGNGTDRLKQMSLDPLRFELGKRSGGAIAQSGARSKGGRSKGKDKKAPKVSLGALSPVVAGSNSYEFSVIYTDDKAIKASSLGKGEILVGRSNQVAELVSKSSSNKGKTYTVVYRVTAPGGTWDAADNGSYELTLKDKQVSDTSRNYIRGKTLGTFSVGISQIGGKPPVDTIVPTAKFSSTKQPTIGLGTYEFTVIYTDDVGINIGSFDDSDILVSDPKGASLPVKKLTIDNGSNAALRTVTYQIAAPGGTWDAADTGIYNVLLQPNQVSDLSGKYAATASLGNFAANFSSIQQTQPVQANTFQFSRTPDANTTTFEIDLSKLDEDPRKDFGLFRGAVLSGSFDMQGSVTKYGSSDLISFKNSNGDTEYRVRFGASFCVGIIIHPEPGDVPSSFSPDSLQSLQTAKSLDVNSGERLTYYYNPFNDTSKIDLKKVPLFSIRFSRDTYILRPSEQNYTLADAIGNVSVRGNELANTIIGNELDNILYGEGGNDYLNGYGTTVTYMYQEDSLTGGSGKDTFILGGSWGASYRDDLNGALTGYAIVRDWNSSEDTIQLAYDSSRYRLSNVQGGSSGRYTYGDGIGIYLNDSGVYTRIAIIEGATDEALLRNSFKFV